MELWQLTAREGIRDTIARYAHLVDGGRFDELVALFTEDAVLEAGDQPPAHGRAALAAFLRGTGDRLAAAAHGPPLIRHHVSNVVVDVTGTAAASARSYFLAVTERGPDHWGRYRDELALSGERWLFTRRQVRVDGRAAGSVFGGDRRP
jgi:3-phenylpropionate/cinnamic acid dioxygenase small subunit